MIESSVYGKAQFIPGGSGKTMLFPRNNHSRFKIRWKPVSDATASKIRKILLNFYDFSAVDMRSIRQIGEWERMSNNFRVPVTLPDGVKKTVLFRKHIQLKDKKSIGLLDRTFLYLSEQGISVPHILRTRSGRTSIYEGGNYFTVYDFLSGDHFRGDEGELRIVARELGRLHRAFKSIPFAGEIKRKKRLLPPWDASGWEYIFRRATGDRAVLAGIIKNNENLIRRSMRDASFLTDIILPRQIVHGDLHPHNTIFSDGRLKAFLDFENTSWAERARDVANAMHRFVRQFAIFRGLDRSASIRRGVRIFLEEYKKQSPFSRTEEDAVPALIKDELLRKLYKDLSMYYKKGEVKFISGGELKKKLALLGEADNFVI